mmetsp:Transcript_52879/g.125842  ORF Transcript_52879/g.125842 Transcript_52879/m.125842 type:complete len:227 (+) Transcript_52879:1403-2083(+)
MGETVVIRGAVRDPYRPHVPLVRDLPPAHLLRLLPRLPPRGDVDAGGGLGHPAADPADAVVDVARVLGDGRGAAPLRRRLRRDVLHPLLHLAASLLLHVRLPRPCCWNPDHNGRRNHDRAGIPPPLRRGLPLVVAVVHDGWLRCLLCLHVRDVPLLGAFEPCHGFRRSRCQHLFRVHGHHLVRDLCPLRLLRVCRDFRLHAQDLRLHQDRLDHQHGLDHQDQLAMD